MTTAVNVLSTPPSPATVRELHEKFDALWANPPRPKKQRRMVRRQMDVCWHSLHAMRDQEIELCWHEHHVLGRALEAAAVCEALIKRSKLVDAEGEPVRPHCAKTGLTLGQRIMAKFLAAQHRRDLIRRLGATKVPLGREEKRKLFTQREPVSVKGRKLTRRQRAQLKAVKSARVATA